MPDISDSTPFDAPDSQSSVETEPVLIDTFAVGPLGCNCTIVGNLATQEAMVIDPGGDAQRILAKLNDRGLHLKWMLHTHAHFDHFLASGQIHEVTGAPMALHPEDRFLWDMVETQCGLFGIPCDGPLPPPTHTLSHDQLFELGNAVQCCALHTPGHTPGSTSFSLPKQALLLAGDTLFRGAVGRTDLWGGDFNALKTSIQSHLYTLDEATRVVTGHGPSTTIGDELRRNPYVNGVTV